ncbi:MAG: LysM peptidoglycan-binding domain-containing protein [Oscillospiraceae bacterium]|nr:LysM peptidoglycan-binding domain-containing protein [Oscillospiraceae bacterium]
MNKRLNDSDLNQVTGGTKLTYTLQEGDTLQKIAEKNHCTVEDICKWNRIGDPNSVLKGQKLELRF